MRSRQREVKRANRDRKKPLHGVTRNCVTPCTCQQRFCTFRLCLIAMFSFWRRPATCEFCNVSSANGFNVIYEVRCAFIQTLITPINPAKQDPNFLAFTDIRPAAGVHVQVVPKKHIGTSLLPKTEPSVHNASGIVRECPFPEKRRCCTLWAFTSSLRENRSLFFTVRSMRTIGNKILDDHNVNFAMRKYSSYFSHSSLLHINEHWLPTQDGVSHPPIQFCESSAPSRSSSPVFSQLQSH